MMTGHHVYADTPTRIVHMGIGGVKGLSPRLMAIVDALPLRTGLRVLEIGCGGTGDRRPHRGWACSRHRPICEGNRSGKSRLGKADSIRNSEPAAGRHRGFRAEMGRPA